MVERVPELAIYCKQIGDFPICHQRYSIQILMEAETEIPDKHCAKLLGKRLVGEREEGTSRGVVMGAPKEIADLSSWELMDAELRVREPACDQTRLSACV